MTYVLQRSNRGVGGCTIMVIEYHKTKQSLNRITAEKGIGFFPRGKDIHSPLLSDPVYFLQEPTFFVVVQLAKENNHTWVYIVFVFWRALLKRTFGPH